MPNFLYNKQQKLQFSFFKFKLNLFNFIYRFHNLFHKKDVTHLDKLKFKKNMFIKSLKIVCHYRKDQFQGIDCHHNIY